MLYRFDEEINIRLRGKNIDAAKISKISTKIKECILRKDINKSLKYTKKMMECIDIDKTIKSEIYTEIAGINSMFGNTLEALIYYYLAIEDAEYRDDKNTMLRPIIDITDYLLKNNLNNIAESIYKTIYIDELKKIVNELPYLIYVCNSAILKYSNGDMEGGKNFEEKFQNLYNTKPILNIKNIEKIQCCRLNIELQKYISSGEYTKALSVVEVILYEEIYGMEKIEYLICKIKILIKLKKSEEAIKLIRYILRKNTLYKNNEIDMRIVQICSEDEDILSEFLDQCMEIVCKNLDSIGDLRSELINFNLNMLFEKIEYENEFENSNRL